MEMNVEIVLETKESKIPTKGTPNSVGYDLYATENIKLTPRITVPINTHLKMKIPDGFYGKIETRSSLARNGIIAVGGIIDSDYRGDIVVLLNNLTEKNYEIKSGERIAQLIFMKYYNFKLKQVDELDKTERVGGFGSTGK